MKIDGECAIIEDPREAVLFRGFVVNQDGAPVRLMAITWDSQFDLIDNRGDTNMVDEFRVTRTQVWEALKPVEGDPVLYFITDLELTGDNRVPNYWFPRKKELGDSYITYLAANALTIGNTIGELRELIAWAREDNDEV